jgi:hypothetical protein
MKLRKFNRSVLVAAALGAALCAGNAGATSGHVHTKTCGHIVTPPPPTPAPVYVTDKVTGPTVVSVVTSPNGDVTTTERTTEVLMFVDPNVSNGPDSVGSISFTSVLGGKMTVTASGEAETDGKSSTNSKLVVTSTKSGTVGLGVDSCNRMLGIETWLTSAGSCGSDADLDYFHDKNGNAVAESIKILFENEVTLESAYVSGMGTGEGMSLSVDGGPKVLLSALLLGTRSFTGNSFEFFASGSACDFGIYLAGLKLSKTDVLTTPASVPEPEALALLLAGLAVVGGVQRRRSAKA